MDRPPRRDRRARGVAWPSRFVALATLPLTLALSIDVDLVREPALKSMPPRIIIAASRFVRFIGLWFVFPWAAVHRRRQAADGGARSRPEGRVHNFAAG